MSRHIKPMLKNMYCYIIEAGLCVSLSIAGYTWLYLLLTFFFMAVITGFNSTK